MGPSEIRIIKETIKDMKEGRLSKKEQMLFVLGIQCGLYSDEPEINDIINEVTEYCLSSKVEYDIIEDIKSYDN